MRNCISDAATSMRRTIRSTASLSDEYIARQCGLRRGHPEDERTLDAEQGSNRLFTEMFYLNCWNLYKPEHEMQMWKGYAPHGVAVKTTFGRLRAAVDKFPDRMFMGVVRYGDEDMTGRQHISGSVYEAAEIPVGE